MASTVRVGPGLKFYKGTRDAVRTRHANMDSLIAIGTTAALATSPLVMITSGVPLSYAARLMKRANVRHLAVFNGREIVGVLSASDIVRAIGLLRREEIPA